MLREAAGNPLALLELPGAGVRPRMSNRCPALIDLDVNYIHSRHPLIRSAVRPSAGLQQLRRVHEALAATLESDPDRRVWHRTALMTGTHEELARELEEAGVRARRRGALDVGSSLGVLSVANR